MRLLCDRKVKLQQLGSARASKVTKPNSHAGGGDKKGLELLAQALQ